MPSQARQDLDDRLSDIDQVFGAHTALTKFKKAEAAANQAGGGLQNITNVVNALVTAPGQGRPAEVAALNRSAFVLLCAHLQGFIQDLHKEAAQHTLNGKVASVDDVVKLVTPRSWNPHADIIEGMFSGIGIYDLMHAPHWNRCTNATVRSRITKYIQERNQIAHGKKPTIHKSKVTGFKKFVVLLADAVDEEVRQQIEGITGGSPW